MKNILAVAAFAGLLMAASSASAFSVYQLQADGNTAHYMAPGVKDNSGIQLNDDPQSDSTNGLTLYKDEDSRFSFNSSYNGARPDSLNYDNRDGQPADPNAPFTGYYLRGR
jgi:hypothetical protein